MISFGHILLFSTVPLLDLFQFPRRDMELSSIWSPTKDLVLCDSWWDTIQLKLMQRESSLRFNLSSCKERVYFLIWSACLSILQNVTSTSCTMVGDGFPFLVSASEFSICTLSSNSDGTETSFTLPFARSSRNSAGFIAMRGVHPIDEK